ncbi:hypothetical protein CJF30_00008397 [Rutstroemia sp. NJR-2017a BBW]|nr:hypothetical protein CJF30_00008397 [Rutstroemia sp. NJR-2017a BBW]
MSFGVPSDEVAEDYKKALEDLTMNSRYEISNLTVIAKENTEHALAISEALRNHIKQTSPQKKLPAFYVLDSIVKNVGTPYTLFFGRSLYPTFMEAYAVVSHDVRRKMDEMLKTWKEPVPGSIDTRPVFPPDVTGHIENALIKARTAAVQAHQEQMRSQQQILGRSRSAVGQAPYRNTPTPPNNLRQHQYPPPGHPGYQQYPSPVNGQPYGVPPNGQMQHALPQQRPTPTQQYPPEPNSSASWQQPQLPGYQSPEASIDSLNNDISNLIISSKAEFSQNPYNSSIQTRLKALLDLQTILQTQTLPPDQIAMIRDQVTQLSEASRPPAPRIQSPRPAPVATPVPPPQQQPTLSSLLGPGGLAALLARQSATPQLSTPPPQPPVAVQPPRLQPAHSYYQPAPPTPVSAPAPPPVADPNSLLERLRAAGMLPAVPASNTPVQPPPPPPPSALPINIPGFPPALPFVNTPPTGRAPLAEIPNDVVLKPASLKMFRPHLISNLYEKLGAPCTQCGRRFQADEEGRKKKVAHLDWHFRVNQRMVEAEKRGQHRSWYVDELDWIKSRESEDDKTKDAGDPSQGAPGAAATADNKPKLQYLPVPDDPALSSSVCPICQEKFEMKWLDDAQEFVWMDAKMVGDRIYHASCYAEATKDRGTPEPTVLGKRKAEDQEHVLRTKIKTEPQ